MCTYVPLSLCKFYLNFFCIYSVRFSYIQIKLELVTPEIVSALKNKELPSHFRLYRKGVTSAHTDGKVTTNRTLHTGWFLQLYSRICFYCHYRILKIKIARTVKFPWHDFTSIYVKRISMSMLLGYHY